MFPYTMKDSCCYLKVNIVFEDGHEISVRDFGNPHCFEKSPELLGKISSGNLGIIELSTILQGKECLGLFIELMFSGHSVEEIESIEWKLLVIKENDDEFSLNSRLLTSPHQERIVSILCSCMGESEKIHEITLLLEDLFPRESELGLDLRGYTLDAVMRESKMVILPEFYTVEYIYSLNMNEMTEDYCIKINDGR